MSDSNSRGQLPLWTKITSAVVGCCALLLFQTYVFTSLPTAIKYKIYRFQFGIVLNIVFYSGSKYLWKRLVNDVLTESMSSIFRLCWKIIVLAFLFLAHASPFTNYFITKEPSIFNMLSWTCFASYIVLFFLLISTYYIFILLSHFFKRSWNFSVRAQSNFAIVTTFVFTLVAFFIAASPPTIIR